MPIYAFQDVMPTIDSSAFIHPDAVIIGDVHIGPNSSVWPGVVIRGDVNFIRIGERTNIQDGSILHVTRPSEKHPNGIPLIIGHGITIGHQVSLHACHLMDGCMIGIGAIVLDQAIVEQQSMVGAGSLVAPRKCVHQKELWIGSPAQRLRTMSDKELNAIAATTQNYCNLAQNYQRSLAKTIPDTLL